jgi:uncharacterized protein
VLCASLGAADEPMRLPVDAAPLAIRSAPSETLFDIEIADTPEERASGLMHRTDLPRNRAMLFDFGDEHPVAMWMQNTPLPLDMIFADRNGMVTKVIESTTPFSQDVLSSDRAVRYVLEVNAGMADQANAAPGARLVHPTIAPPPQ